MTSTWTTRILPDLTRRFGVEEIHSVWFTPNGWPGKGTVISLGIPECELQVCMLAADGEPVTFINRPSTNRDVKGWIRTVCALAKAGNVIVSFSCDTAEQAARAAKMAARLLPNYQRVALERMYDPASRVRGKLS